MKAGINLPEGFYTVDEKPCEIQRGSKEYSEMIYKVNINSQHTFYPLCFDLTERIIALLP